MKTNETKSYFRHRLINHDTTDGKISFSQAHRESVHSSYNHNVLVYRANYIQLFFYLVRMI